jgi:hypothetical protein
MGRLDEVVCTEVVWTAARHPTSVGFAVFGVWTTLAVSRMHVPVNSLHRPSSIHRLDPLREPGCLNVAHVPTVVFRQRLLEQRLLERTTAHHALPQPTVSTRSIRRPKDAEVPRPQGTPLPVGPETPAFGTNLAPSCGTRNLLRKAVFGGEPHTPAEKKIQLEPTTP